ncbi:MAG: phosphomethylpyrimidine synthase ThiC, partial [Pseudomonadota bacterium]
MSANPKELLKPASSLSVEATRPFPNSRKIFVSGSRADIRVGMREVTLTSTPSKNGAEENPPVTIYDTSGPYSDPAATIDLRQGLAPLRKPWILERNDTEQLGGPSSEYGRARERDPNLTSLRFEHIRQPRRAKGGANVSQMHYARQGMITPEMEYVAIRETLRLNEFR